MATDTSPIDGSLLLPIEQMTPSNIASFSTQSAALTDVSTYMQGVQTAVYNYEMGYTSKIVLNPADLQTYIEKIRQLTLYMAGGYADDGVTVISAQAANILPDLLMTLRSNQLHLCRLYGVYEDSQGATVGPLEDVTIETTSTGGTY